MKNSSGRLIHAHSSDSYFIKNRDQSNFNKINPKQKVQIETLFRKHLILYKTEVQISINHYFISDCFYC